MAQVLKEEVRQRIILATKEELLDKGYDKASLRNIADKADVTVGNLYRYFKNKDELIKMIIYQPLKLINDYLLMFSNSRISFDKIDFELNQNQLEELLKGLVDVLMICYLKYYDEMRILMMDTKVSFEIEEWLVRILSQKRGLNKHLANAYAVSLFAGFRNLFENKIAESELKELINSYLKAFFRIW